MIMIIIRGIVREPATGMAGGGLEEGGWRTGGEAEREGVCVCGEKGG
jgi:hypothetical protein